MKKQVSRVGTSNHIPQIHWDVITRPCPWYLLLAQRSSYEVYSTSQEVYTRCVLHNDDVIMGAIASQITSLTIVYSIVYSDADQRKHQSSALMAFVWGIHRGPVKSPHKWPVTQKMFPFDDVIMFCSGLLNVSLTHIPRGYFIDTIGNIYFNKSSIKVALSKTWVALEQNVSV